MGVVMSRMCGHFLVCQSFTIETSYLRLLRDETAARTW